MLKEYAGKSERYTDFASLSRNSVVVKMSEDGELANQRCVGFYVALFSFVRLDRAPDSISSWTFPTSRPLTAKVCTQAFCSFLA